MNDDYLWDGSGTPDAEVQRLEALLGRLRSTPLPLNFDRIEPTAAKPAVWTGGYLAPFAAAAAAVFAMIALTWQTTRRASWEIAQVEGRPRIGSTPLAGAGRLAIGDTL